MIFRWHTPFRYLAAQIRLLWAKAFGYETLVTGDEWDTRRGICAECPELRGDQCRICTCFVDAKAYMAQERCPKRKWGRIWRRKR